MIRAKINEIKTKEQYKGSMKQSWLFEKIRGKRMEELVQSTLYTRMELLQ
jgi:hypothetical protein